MPATCHLNYFKKSICFILYLGPTEGTIRANGFPYGYFLLTNGVSPLNNYFPVLFLTTLISTSNTTNNDQSRLPYLISHFNGMLSIMLAFVYSVLRIYIRSIYLT